MSSAYIHTPPANERDELIVKGFFLLAGPLYAGKDPKNGFPYGPTRPKENYQFESRGPHIMAGLAVCMVIVTVVTFLRLGIRVYVHDVRFGADDWLIIPAYLLSMAYPAIQFAMIRYGGAGKHFYDMTYQEYYYYKFLAGIDTTIFAVYVGIVKMSIALFNLRLTTLTSGFWKKVNWAFFAICAGYTVVALFMNIFKCNPVYASWDLVKVGEYGQAPKCVSIAMTGNILRFNLALDFTALAIPTIIIWKIRLSWGKKARIIGLLSIGLIACIAGVMTSLTVNTQFKDPLHMYQQLLAWLMVEIVGSQVAACAPTLAYFLPKSMFSSKDPNSKGTGNKVDTIGTAFRSRTRPSTREDDRDEEELRIIVKEEIMMEWKGNSRGDGYDSQVSVRSGEGGSVTSWCGEDRDRAKTGAL